MQNQINKIKGLISIAKKANYIVFGADNLKNYNKKLYLLIKANNAGKDIQKICEKYIEFGIDCIEFDFNDMQNITNLDNCKILGLKNKGLSEAILNIIRGESIGK
ncbi:MAG: hypothetical protein IJA69_04070 [Clostridia bacterium]|nr:hypothetical protein [Clostridia bacterium]